MKAALNLAARRNRKRILNRDEWREGLGGIAEDFESRNVQRLSDDQVRNVVAAAHEIDRAFGLYMDLVARLRCRFERSLPPAGRPSLKKAWV